MFFSFGLHGSGNDLSIPGWHRRHESNQDDTCSAACSQEKKAVGGGAERMAKWNQKTYLTKDPRTSQKYAARAEKSPQIYRKRPNEHHRCVERCIDPRRFVDSKMQRTPDIRQVHVHQP